MNAKSSRSSTARPSAASSAEYDFRSAFFLFSYARSVFLAFSGAIPATGVASSLGVETFRPTAAAIEAVTRGVGE